jgi:predicted transcriptional regulator
MGHQLSKDGRKMAKPALKKSEHPAQEHLTDVFGEFLHKQISEMSIEEVRASKKKFDKTIDEALASRLKRRGTR